MMSPEETSANGMMDRLARIVELVMLTLTVMMVALVSYQVFQRYVLHYTPPWSEELAVYLMIWFGVLAMAAGVRRQSHMALNYFADHMPKLVQKSLTYFKYIITILYAAIMANEGMNMVLLTLRQKSPAMGISVSYVYLALPVGMILIIAFSLEMLYKESRKGRSE